MTAVALTPLELAYAWQLTLYRRSRHADPTGRLFRKDSGGLEVDYLGAIGELAFAKHVGLPMALDYSPTPRARDSWDDGADFVVGGQRVQVKATDRADGRLIFPVAQPRRADWYVLARVLDGTGARVELAGKASAADVSAHAVEADLGRGKTLVYPTAQLRPIAARKEAA